MTWNRFAPPLLLLALAAGAASTARAQPARLVRDLNSQGEPGSPSSSSPRQLRSVGGRTVFLTGPGGFGRDQPHDLSLRASEGDTVETLASLCTPACVLDPQLLNAGPDLLYVYATVTVGNGYEANLWRSDGTRAGTWLVWRADPRGSLFTPIVFRRRLYFGSCDPGGCGLWTSDGSVDGTRKVSPAVPYDLAVAEDRLYFLGSDGRRGLFVSDGTAAGTRVVRRLPEGGGVLWLLTAAGRRLFFMTGDYSGELWTSDGTREGTHWFRTFPESSSDHVPLQTSFLVPHGDRIYFLSSGLWTTDGRGTGPRRASRLNQTFVYSTAPQHFAFVADGRLLHVEGDGISGNRLWLAGTTPEETVLLAGCPGGCPVAAASELFPLGDGRVLFRGEDAEHGAELWLTDGTGAGTRRIADLCPGPCSGDPGAFRREGGRLFFSGRAGAGFALYTSDLTAAGTLPLAPLDAESARSPQVAGRPGRWSFSALDPNLNLQLWTSDGTPAGSRPVPAPPAPSASSAPQELANLGGRLLFNADDGQGRALWIADPSGLGAVPLLPAAALDGDTISGLTVAGPLAYFFKKAGRGTGSQPPGGSRTPELWRTDGTPAGTVRLADFGDREPSLPLAAGGRFFFLVTSPPGEPPLLTIWTSDGSPEGTQPRVALPPDALRVPWARAAGNDLYLIVRREAEHQLFRTDGTPEGTRPVYTFECEECLDEAEELGFAHANGRVWFTTLVFRGSGAYQRRLFRSDGTAAGTVQAVPAREPGAPYVEAFPELAAFGSEPVYLAYAPTLRPGANRPFGLFRGAEPPVPLRAVAYSGDTILHFTPVPDADRPGAGLLFFRGGDLQHGMELWVSDGTAAGTHFVKDIQPGPLSGEPQELTAAAGRLYFTAIDPEHGRELWQSDGTAEGTFRVQDIAPGAASSSPQWLTESGGRLYFSADDGQTGREPWSLPLAEPQP